MFEDISGGTVISPSTGTGLAGGSDNNVSVSFSRGSIRYDSPFLDMTSTFIPKSIKGILKFIAAYVVSDGLLSQCISKLSEYPITDLIYKDEDETFLKDDKTIEKWKNILENSMNIKRVLIQSNMDYYAYGNSIVSVNYPFKRMLKCPKCNQSHTVAGLEFEMQLPRAGGYPSIEDEVPEDYRGLIAFPRRPLPDKSVLVLVVAGRHRRRLPDGLLRACER